MYSKVLKKNCVFTGISFLLSCGSPVSESSCPSVDWKEGVSRLGRLDLGNEIEQVTYIPLEVTDDDASLIDGISCYALTSKCIYVVPVKEVRVALFDREGHFLKTLIPFGSGPGEINGAVSGIQADEKNDRLYLYGMDRMMSYTLDGEYLETIVFSRQSIYQRKLDTRKVAAVSMPYVPFEQGSFGIGIFTEKGDLVISKNDFSSPLVPPAQTGLTIRMGLGYSEIGERSLLAKIGGNDTIFRLTDDRIEPACILRIPLSNEEIQRSLDVTNFNGLRDFGDGSDCFVSDLFETKKCYYFRLRNNEKHYVASVDKQTGTLQVERCEQPADLRELASATQLYGLLGTKSYQNFPIWGSVVGNELVQVVTSGELDFYRNLHSISIPAELQAMDENNNPFFIFYKLN